MAASPGRIIALFAVTWGMMLAGAPSSSAAGVVGFVDQPNQNSSNWADALPSATDVSVLDFEDHPLGSLDGDFYEASTGVSFEVSNAEGPLPFDVEYGTGPGDFLTSGPAVGEGPHPTSRYLEFSRYNASISAAKPARLDLSFDHPVMAVGLFTIDLYAGSELSLEAFDHPDPDHGEADSLGVFNRPGVGTNNYQTDLLYFMGLIDDASRIRSARLTFGADSLDSIGVDDIQVATSTSPDGGTTIPVPGTMGLIAAAGLGLLSARRRRGRRRATTCRA